MILFVKRYGLEIVSETSFFKEEDIAYIEDTLGLKKDGDSIKLVRKNASGLSCLAYLEAKPEK